MANQSINIQVSFQGPSPMITRANGSVDWRTSLINLKRLFAGIDKGSQYRNPNTARPPVVPVQQPVVQAPAPAPPAAVALNDTLSIGGPALPAKQGRATGPATAATVLAGTTITVNGQ